MERRILTLANAGSADARLVAERRQRRGAFQDMRSAHRRALSNAITEMEGIAGNATLVINMLQESLAQNTNVQVQPQVNYINGALARFLKDQGVIEHMQALRNEKSKVVG